MCMGLQLTPREPEVLHAFQPGFVLLLARFYKREEQPFKQVLFPDASLNTDRSHAQGRLVLLLQCMFPRHCLSQC